MKKLFLIVLLSLTTLGCSSMGPQEERWTSAGVVTGGIIGSFFGTGSGHIVGAAIGATLGGVAGNYVGQRWDEQEEDRNYGNFY